MIANGLAAESATQVAHIVRQAHLNHLLQEDGWHGESGGGPHCVGQERSVLQVLELEVGGEVEEATFLEAELNLLLQDFVNP